MRKISLLYCMIRGALGKKLVVKHYGRKVVVTRYPNMNGIVPSEEQKKCRNLFREAVAFARKIYEDQVQREAYRKKYKKSKRLFSTLVKEYMKGRKEKRAIAPVRANVMKMQVTKEKWCPVIGDGKVRMMKIIANEQIKRCISLHHSFTPHYYKKGVIVNALTDANQKQKCIPAGILIAHDMMMATG